MQLPSFHRHDNDHDTKSPQSRAFFAWPQIAALAVAVTAVAAGWLLETAKAGSGARMFDEGRWIESASAALWFAAATFALTAAIRVKSYRGDKLLVAYALFMFGMREVGLQTRIPPWHVAIAVRERTRFSLPLAFWTIVAAALLFAYLAAGRRWVRRFAGAWAAGRPWSGAVLWAAMFLLLAEAAEDIGHNQVLPLIVDRWLFVAAEESLEFGASLLGALLTFTLMLRSSAETTRLVDRGV